MWVFNSEFCTGEVETTTHDTWNQAMDAYGVFMNDWAHTYGEDNVFFTGRVTMFRYPGCEWNYCSVRAA